MGGKPTTFIMVVVGVDIPLKLLMPPLFIMVVVGVDIPLKLLMPPLQIVCSSICLSFIELAANGALKTFFFHIDTVCPFPLHELHALQFV